MSTCRLKMKSSKASPFSRSRRRITARISRALCARWHPKSWTTKGLLEGCILRPAGLERGGPFPALAASHKRSHLEIMICIVSYSVLIGSRYFGSRCTISDSTRVVWVVPLCSAFNYFRTSKLLQYCFLITYVLLGVSCEYGQFFCKLLQVDSIALHFSSCYHAKYLPRCS